LDTGAIDWHDVEAPAKSPDRPHTGGESEAESLADLRLKVVVIQVAGTI
jgi:hypothetical protein